MRKRLTLSERRRVREVQMAAARSMAARLATAPAVVGAASSASWRVRHPNFALLAVLAAVAILLVSLFSWATGISLREIRFGGISS